MQDGESLLEKSYRLQSLWSSNPSDFALFREWADVLQQLGDYDSLLGLLNQQVSSRVFDGEPLLLRAGVLNSLGDFDGAKADYLRILDHQPDHAEAILALVDMGHGSEIGGVEKVDSCRKTLSPEHIDHVRLGYARARLLEQQGEFADAFATLREVNKAHAAIGGMQIAAKRKGAALVLNDLTDQVIERFSGFGHSSERPIFIVGMPRSGTTLTEQILGRHPQVYPAGERLFWGQVLNKLVQTASGEGASLIEAIHFNDSDAWRSAGQQYLDKMAELDSVALRTTDKLPANFALLPLIRLVFPNARIIHLRRNPLATIGSCIRTAFSEYSLALSVEDWARFYGMYQAMMDRWRPMLGDQLYELEYEQLASDFPAKARELLEFSGLPWDDACLFPEQNQGPVRTASFMQVRQKVHTAAVSAWKCYQAELEPLLPLIEQTRQEVGSTIPG